jgi:hypothetical protein
MFSKILFVAGMLLPFLSLGQKQDNITEKGHHPAHNYDLLQTDYKQQGSPMPALEFMAYDDTTTENKQLNRKEKKRAKRSQLKSADSSNANLYHLVKAKDLNNNGNLFIMMFNPTCLHCEDAAFMFEKNIELFKKTQIVLLANKLMSEYIPDFAQRHHVARYPSMYIGYDSSQYIDNTFLYQALPQINIYNHERKLLKTYCGEVSIDTLKKYID